MKKGCCGVVVVACASAMAGPLNPPAGPVASSYKTLTEVEPRVVINATNTPGDATNLFKITQPGSYYLTGNITGVVGKHGIEIASDGVTLDLNGFQLVGVPGMGGFNGVHLVLPFLENITVVNGSVQGWGGNGVWLEGSGESRRVAGLLLSNNLGAGLSTGDGVAIANCAAAYNGGHGIVAGTGCTVTNCSTVFNYGSGLVASFASAITNCTASWNGECGFCLDSGASITNCVANANVLDGFLLDGGCTITNCMASGNDAHGVSADNGAKVVDCVVRTNQLDGIVCSSDCLIRGNVCDGNGNSTSDGAGILVTSSDNRIEGNNCTDNDRGIDVNGAGNIIILNTCSGNTTNWDVAAGNNCLVILAVDAGAILGDSGGVSIGSGNPFANFTY